MKKNHITSVLLLCIGFSAFTIMSCNQPGKEPAFASIPDDSLEILRTKAAKWDRLETKAIEYRNRVIGGHHDLFPIGDSLAKEIIKTYIHNYPDQHNMLSSVWIDSATISYLSYCINSGYYQDNKLDGVRIYLGEFNKDTPNPYNHDTIPKGQKTMVLVCTRWHDRKHEDFYTIKSNDDDAPYIDDYNDPWPPYRTDYSTVPGGILSDKKIN